MHSALFRNAKYWLSSKSKNHKDVIGHKEDPPSKIETKSKSAWWTSLGNLSWNGPGMIVK